MTARKTNENDQIITEVDMTELLNGNTANATLGKDAFVTLFPGYGDMIHNPRTSSLLRAE